MLRYNKLRDLVGKGEWVSALRLLERSACTLDDVVLLSLLYRFLGQVNQEYVWLLRGGAATLGDKGYIDERRVELKRMRRASVMPRAVVPRAVDEYEGVMQALEKTCFVTAGDDTYYGLLEECVESVLQACPWSNVEVIVVDCGLTDGQRKRLRRAGRRVRCISGREWVRPSGKGSEYLLALMARGTLRELCLGYRYCIWIDADAWILDQEAIFESIRVAKDQGMSVVRHPVGVQVNERHVWVNRGTLTDKQKRTLMGYPAIIACWFCADLSSEVYAEYCETLKRNVATGGLRWGSDQDVLLYIAAKWNLEPLHREYAFEGVPNMEIGRNGGHGLYSRRKRCVKVYHIGGGRKHEQKWRRFIKGRVKEADGSWGVLETSRRFCVPEELGCMGLRVVIEEAAAGKAVPVSMAGRTCERGEEGKEGRERGSLLRSVRQTEP